MTKVKREDIINFYKNSPEYFGSYKRWHEEKGLAKIESEVLTLIKQYFSGKILDAGCGSGSTTLFLVHIFPMSQIVGVDISAHAIHLLNRSVKRKRLKNVKGVVSNLQCLPFLEESFDCIFCYSVLEHVLDIKRALKELVRVLKRGGLLLVRYTSDYSFRERLLSAFVTPFKKEIEFDEIIPSQEFKVIETNKERKGNLDVTKIDFFKFMKYSNSLGLREVTCSTFPEVDKSFLKLILKSMPVYPFKYLGKTLIMLMMKSD